MEKKKKEAEIYQDLSLEHRKEVALQLFPVLIIYAYFSLTWKQVCLNSCLFPTLIWAQAEKAALSGTNLELNAGEDVYKKKTSMSKSSDFCT